MLSIKPLLISAVAAFIAGALTGYSIRDDQAEIDSLNLAKSALEEENKNLIKQLEVEHEYQEAAQVTAEQTQKDLDELENRYADAVNELNAMQLQQLSYVPEDTSALSEDAEPAVTIPQSAGKCPGENKAKFQQLYENQLMIAKDCDITATYYNRLIDLYESIKTQSE